MCNTAEGSGEVGQSWECQLCGREGERIGVYGICSYRSCRGVRTEGTFRDRTETRKRKVETVLGTNTDCKKAKVQECSGQMGQGKK